MMKDDCLKRLPDVGKPANTKRALVLVQGGRIGKASGIRGGLQVVTAETQAWEAYKNRRRPLFERLRVATAVLFGQETDRTLVRRIRELELPVRRSWPA